MVIVRLLNYNMGEVIVKEIEGGPTWGSQVWSRRWQSAVWALAFIVLCPVTRFSSFSAYDLWKRGNIDSFFCNAVFKQSVYSLRIWGSGTEFLSTLKEMDFLI